MADIRETAKAEAERVYPETEWTNRATVLALREALEQGYRAAWRTRGEADAGAVERQVTGGRMGRVNGARALAAIRALDEGGQ